MRYGPLVVFVALSVLPASWVLGQAAQDPAEPIGRVTAAFGVAAVETPDGVRKGDLNTLIVNGDRVRTNGGGVTVLLASRVVLKIDNDTSLSLSESSDQLNIILERGTVHVFVGQRPLAAGVVCVQDPHARAETQQGVFLASYDPSSRSGYYACEHATLTVESSDSSQRITLAPDKQLVVSNGQFEQAEDLDRMAFNNRKQSLERLGQAVKEQGAETFRLRSRMFDTQLAINQLSEAGWIDASTLQAQAQQKASKSESQSEEESETSSSEPKSSDNSNSGSSSSADRPAPVEEPANASAPVVVEPPAATPAAEPSGSGQNSSGNSGNSGRSGNRGPGNANVDAVALPAETPASPPVVGLDLQPDKSAKIDLDVEPPVQPKIDLDVNPSSGAPTPTIDLDVQPKIESSIGDSVAVPKLDLEVKDNKGKGKDAKPKLDLDLKDKTKGPSTPKIDLDLPGGSSGPGPGGLDVAAPAPKIDLAAPAPKIDTLAPAPKVDLAAPAPKLDLGLKDTSVAAPAKADLGLGGAAVPPPAPKVELGGLRDTNIALPPPKVDLGLKDAATSLTPAPAPKLDLDVKAPPPPTIDIKTPTDITPKLDLAKPAVDLPPPPKIDLGGATLGSGVPAPKLDLDPKTVTDAIAPPKLDIDPKVVSDVAVPKLDLDLKLDAPKLDIPTDLSKDAALPTKDAVIDIPTPTDVGLDVTKDITKDAIDTVTDITKDASGHDGSSSDKGSKKRRGK